MDTFSNNSLTINTNYRNSYEAHCKDILDKLTLLESKLDDMRAETQFVASLLRHELDKDKHEPLNITCD